MTGSFYKILIANRGEISVRIMRACRQMGIATVAVYTDADETWASRDMADEAVRIGAGPAATSYLDFDKIIGAARRTGAQAIHPGYGFLAENAEFARRCAREQIAFIGPPPEVVDLMGNKASAKALAAGLGVHVVPGVDGSTLTDEGLLAEAGALGFPLIIKAVAGGGGMAMRVVEDRADLAEALAAVRREAMSAFADDRVLIEKYFPTVRHIEVQVAGDSAGNVVHLFERECSVQRRRQKLIEEAPSAFVSAALRERLCTASVAIAAATRYQGVGTVEFVVVDDERRDQFYFLEMNTRLQVEHGVTEAVTGVDLVRLQIELAEGKPLPFQQTDVRLRGHAIECRLCAEQPARGFSPATGRILAWSAPEEIRVDTGIREGTEVSTHYDSLLAKLIVTAPSRELALRQMTAALRRTQLLGLDTNLNLLSAILADRGFGDGAADTRYLERNVAALTQVDSALRSEIAIVGALAASLEDTRALAPGQGGTFTRTYSLVLEGVALQVQLSWLDSVECRVTIGNHTHDVRAHPSAQGLRVEIDGLEKLYQTRALGESLFLQVPGHGSFCLERGSTASKARLPATERGYSAPMAGQVVALLAQAGDEIQSGQTLLVIESMKMEHRVVAHTPGVIAEVRVQHGQAVHPGMVLLKVA